MKSILTGLLLFLTASIAFYACQKDDDNGSASVGFRLTDGPGPYDHVYLDIQQVEVTVSGSSKVSLTPINPGVYDLLEFRNGLDTLLVRADIPAGQVQQIRLILGNDNSVVIDGTSYPLNTPSAQESGVKLNLHENFEANGSYEVWIDFDAAKSIVKTGNGTYKLKPVIRAYSEQTNGRIKGYVLPLTAGAVVYAANVNTTDTLSAIPAATDGFFVISGATAGTYKVWIEPLPASGLQVFTKTDVVVTFGAETNLGTVTLVP